MWSQPSYQSRVKVEYLTEGIGQMNLESAENVAMTEADGESNQAGLLTDNLVEKENLSLAKGNFPNFFRTIYVNYIIYISINC